MDDKAIYFSKIPFMWRKYEIDDIVENERVVEPFYHVNRGYIFATSKGMVAIPMASYAGGLYGIYLKDRPEHAGCETGPCVVQEIRSGKG